MKKVWLGLVSVIFLLAAFGYWYYHSLFPYGQTHRCSLFLMGDLVAYAEDLKMTDEGFAIAWDKIPLSHNGQKLDYNPREVFVIGHGKIQVKQADWKKFLTK